MGNRPTQLGRQRLQALREGCQAGRVSLVRGVVHQPKGIAKEATKRCCGSSTCRASVSSEGRDAQLWGRCLAGSREVSAAESGVVTSRTRCQAPDTWLTQSTSAGKPQTVAAGPHESGLVSGLLKDRGAAPVRHAHAWTQDQQQHGSIAFVESAGSQVAFSKWVLARGRQSSVPLHTPKGAQQRGRLLPIRELTHSAGQFTGRTG